MRNSKLLETRFRTVTLRFPRIIRIAEACPRRLRVVITVDDRFEPSVVVSEVPGELLTDPQGTDVVGLLRGVPSFSFLVVGTSSFLVPPGNGVFARASIVNFNPQVPTRLCYVVSEAVSEDEGLC